MRRSFSILLLSIVFATTTLSVSACGCCGNKESTNISSVQQSDGQQQVAEEKVQCPVMKNWILPSEAADLTEYNGKTYYFCCGGCKERFLAEPEKYIESQS